MTKQYKNVVNTGSHRHFELRRWCLALEVINGATRNPQPMFDTSACDLSSLAVMYDFRIT